MYLEAPDAVVPLELFAVLVPFQGGDGVPVGLAPELDGLTGRDGVELLLHLLWMSPLRSHGWRTTQRAGFGLGFTVRYHLLSDLLELQLLEEPGAAGKL